MKKYLSIILLCNIQLLCAQSEKMEARINAIMTQTKSVGLSVAVVKKNKIIYTHSFGLKDIATNTPLTDDCLFRIASVSKSFTATAIMQLVEAKKLSLDDDISNLIGFKIRNPKFPETVITIRMLLMHRSSINDSQGYFTLDAINPSKNLAFAKCYNAYEPANGYLYCNLNFNLAGAIVEKVSGERFDMYVKKHILDPLKIAGGYCVDSLNKYLFATLYEFNNDSARFDAAPGAYNPRSAEIANYELGYSTPIFSPAGGMKISATDLAKYMIMHSQLGIYNGQRIITKKSALEMQPSPTDKEAYALALLSTEKLIANKTMKGHTGSAYGLFSAMFFNPTEKFGIVVICNGTGPGYTNGFNTVIKQTVNCLYDALIDSKASADPIKSIKISTLTKGRDSGTTWFLPRVCSVPNNNGVKAFMTLQEITGSDYYGPVHWSESSNGKNWSKPVAVPGLGRKLLENEVEEAVSDVISQYHPKTNTLLSIGEILYYKKGKFFREQPPRFPIYITRDSLGNWSERKKLEWNDPRNSAIYSAGSAQFVVLPNGDLLIPVTFRNKEKVDCSVTTLLCSFDGKTISVKKAGVTLNNTVLRGLLEPQLIQLGAIFYLTIRAEDGYGYVSESTDGLTWSKPMAWAWEDGNALTMSTTQQHWMTHGKDLYLVYTRKAEDNANVMRWRAPLYLAKVNRSTMHLMQQTERIVFPLVGDGINSPKLVPQYGNFHVTNIGNNESWITSGEVIQANFKGDMLMGRVTWKK